MSNLQRWWLRATVLIIALILPFYFLHFGSQPIVDFDDGSRFYSGEPIFISSEARTGPVPIVFTRDPAPIKLVRDPAPTSKYTIEPPAAADGFTRDSIFTSPQGIWARPGYSRGQAAIGGLLVPFILFAGIGYSFLRRNE